MSYTYYSNGLPASTEADGAVVTMEYDVAGNRTLISDPDAGDVSSTYSADGLLLSRTDARGVTTTNTLGRFLSPDTYVQEPTNSQNFNRYSYCLNNPLKYCDPSGELFGVDDLIVAAASFVVSYFTNSISSNNWGWSSVSKSLISAGMSLAGFHMNKNIPAWKYAGLVAANGALNSVLPPMTISVGNHFTFNAFPSLTFGTDGINFGVFSSIGYHNNDISFSVGGSLSTRYQGWRISAGYGDVELSYSKTYYPSESYGDYELGKQSVGTFSLNFAGECTFSISNDLWGDGQDRWRTHAAELSIKDISIGTYVYTNWGLKESGYEHPDRKGAKESDALEKDVKIDGIGINTRWKNGHAYFAPLWVGVKHNGVTYRFGHSNKHIHNATQNYIHQKFKKGPYFYNDEPYFKTGFYSMQGNTNPLSLFY